MRNSIAIAGATAGAAGNAALLVALHDIVSMWGEDSRVFDGPEMLGLLYVVFLVYAAIVGLPVALYMRRRNAFRLGPSIFAGAAVGALPPFVVYGLDYLLRPTYYTRWVVGVLEICAYGAVLGATSALVFYWLYRAMSPNNSFKPKPLRGSA